MTDQAPAFPPLTAFELPGWELAWFRLFATGKGAPELAELRSRTARQVCALADEADVVAGEPAQGLRRLFRAAGCDPTRYRPSSEALLRRVRKSGELPAIHPLVDLNNLLSLRLLAPCCVVDAATLHPPFVLRAGRAGEAMVSLRGPFNLEGKPVLVDGQGPFGTPITDSERVKVTSRSAEVWLVAYLAAGHHSRAEVEATLNELLAAAPVARLEA